MSFLQEMKIIVSSEISQIEKVKYYMFSLMLTKFRSKKKKE
jgi:hypothetical protein